MPVQTNNRTDLRAKLAEGEEIQQPTDVGVVYDLLDLARLKIEICFVSPL